MAGQGSNIYIALPPSLTAVLKGDEGDAAPLATRLIGTIGPASQSVPVLERLMRAQMRIARFDLTCNDLAFHLQSYRNLRQACSNTNMLCAVMINIAGPDLCVVNRPGTGKLNLEAGKIVRLTNEVGTSASANILPINWPGTFTNKGITPGSSVFVGQYLFTGAETSSAYLTVQQVDPESVTCVINNNCTLPTDVHLQIKFASMSQNPLPCISAKDEAALVAWAEATAAEALGAETAGPTQGAAGIDFVALPRTRTARDIEQCRAVLDRIGLRHTRIMAKLECMEGLVNHVEILRAADAVIFSRGSLGTCLEPEKVFLAQKMLLYEANTMGKPVYVTRILDTMTECPRPTRAEATDMANLVLDGADGVMLGSETFRGMYPVEALRTVAAICRAAEAVFDNYAFYRSIMDKQDMDPTAVMDRAEHLASSAVRAAHKMDAKLIVVFTVTGRTARLIAKFKPSQPVLTVVCKDPNASRFAAASMAYTKNGHAKSPPVAELLSKGMNKIGSETLLSTAQLKSWSHGTQAKACLMYRGTLPITMDAPSGSNEDVLESVLEYAKEIGLVAAGDRVVVSQCPRQINSEVMSEAGVVSLITVDHELA